MQTPTLSVVRWPLPGATWIAVSGDLDHAAARWSWYELEAMVTRPGRAVLDLRGVEFMDVSGFRLVCALAEACAGASGRLVIVPSPVVGRLSSMLEARRALELVEVRDALDLVGGLPDADATPAADPLVASARSLRLRVRAECARQQGFARWAEQLHRARIGAMERARRVREATVRCQAARVGGGP